MILLFAMLSFIELNHSVDYVTGLLSVSYHESPLLQTRPVIIASTSHTLSFFRHLI